MKLLSCFLLFAALVAAQGPEPQRPPAFPHIRVTGEATVSTRPDLAEVDIGVVTQAPTADAAAAQNAQQLDAVVTVLRKQLGANASIRTTGYSLAPNYRYPREGGRPTINGYTATNVVQVKTERLAEVGKVIDQATQSGANTIQRLRFTLKNEGGARAQALREAATDARDKANALAAALGLRVVRIASVTEGEPARVIPLSRETMMTMAQRSEAAPTPVEPGTVDVRATVTLVVEVAQ